MPSLLVVRGRDQGKHFPLQSDVIRVGRDGANDIQLLDSEASRSHCEFRRDDSFQWQVVDLGSSNGTRINGQKSTQKKLVSGDRIEIGGTTLVFQAGGNSSIAIADHSVDIVRQGPASEKSRIVSSLTPAVANVSDSDWGSAKLSDADRSLEVMYLTALAVGRTDDLDDLMNRVLRLVFDWVEADRGCIMLRDTESGQLQPSARCDRDSDQLQPAQQRILISRTILDYVMDRKEGVRTSDARDDARFDAAASIVQGGVREAICVPLQGRYDIVGAMYIDTYISPGERVKQGGMEKFTDDHLRLITAIGHQAALAIEDTNYYSALVQSERLAAMGQTIATLSHHVKNILQGIRGGSYLIEAGLERSDTDAVRRGWGIVDRNQQRISNLVLDMLTFSKERKPEAVDADLNETVADVTELMRSVASDRNVLLNSDLADDMPTAHFDPDALHRAILNLVTNAIDAVSDKDPEDEQNSKEDSFVLIRTRYTASDGWMIDVIDNGPGVSEEDRQKIFSLFESSKGQRGTGLGLPVSAKIMREHGGEIQVLDAKPPGVTCFRLRLPSKEGTASEYGTNRETMS